MKPKPNLKTATELARLAGVHQMTMRQRLASIEPDKVERDKAGTRNLYDADSDRVKRCMVKVMPRQQGGPTKQAIEEEKLRKLKLENDRRERMLIPRVEVIRTLSTIHGSLRGDLKRMLVDEYPPEVAGLTVDGARVYGQKVFDRICRAFEQAGKNEWRY